MDFLGFIRKVAQEKKERDFVQKGGPGSGWHAPPKGTHTAGAKAEGRAAKPTKHDMQRAAKVAMIADHAPSKLRGVAVTSLLAARGVTEDVRVQYGGEKGKSAQRVMLDNRLKTLDTELKRRGVDDPAGAVNKQWPEWERMGKITFGAGKGQTHQAAAAAISGKSLKDFSEKELMGAIDRIEGIARAESKQARQLYGDVLSHTKYRSPQQAITPALDKIYAELARRKK